MVTSALQGGLGNKMFQIAASVAHAKKMGTYYGFYDFAESRYFEGPFNMSVNPIATGMQYKEQGFHYEPIPKFTDVELFGYFQSEKYFKDYEKDIRNLFRPEKKIGEYIDSKYDLSNSVAIHIRRGDYLQLSDYHYNLELQYYATSIQEFDGTHNFYLFTDDVEYGAELCQNWGLTLIHEDPAIDLLIMSKCNHHIIANSSFSWWGAWLGKKEGQIVIAPSRWFGPRKAHLNTSDLIPEGWKILQYA